MVDFWKGKKVIVTGGHGFLGTHLVNELRSKGCIPFVPISRHYDLRFPSYINSMMENTEADILFHLAGNVGGIGYNQTRPYTLFYDNAIMGINLIHAAIKYEIKKFVQIGTVCSYPSETYSFFKERYLWDGYPELTNAPYGIAKRMLLTQLQSARKEFGLNGIYLIPTNLYGPGDEFADYKSHVIPALIKKFINARNDNLDYVEVWGEGTLVTRDFLYVKDAASGIVKAAENYNHSDPLNLGTGIEIEISYLAEMIKSLVEYKGYIGWDNSKPEGQIRRSLDISKAKKELQWESEVTLQNGLIETIKWYEDKINVES